MSSPSVSTSARAAWGERSSRCALRPLHQPRLELLARELHLTDLAHGVDELQQRRRWLAPFRYGAREHERRGRIG